MATTSSIDDCLHADSSDKSSTSNRPICQGSMGLHQNNFSFDHPIHLYNGTHERTIVEVFRKFCDKCMLKLKDGINTSPKKPKTSSASDTVDLTDSDNKSDNESVNIDDLPFYCKLIILSKLETIDICHLSMTSRHWREVCSDEVLWRELLYRDMIKWHSIGFKSLPIVPLSCFCETVCDSGKSNDEVNKDDQNCLPMSAYDLHARLSSRKDVNFKALYFHSAYQRQLDYHTIGSTSSFDSDTDYNAREGCSPASPTGQQLASNQSFPRFLRNLWMRMRSANGEVIMLGPGLESRNTSKIFNRILWARPDLLITQGLLPGSQDGVGSGVELDFKGEKRFNLIALYSANHRDRVRRHGLERLQQSNIVEEIQSHSNDQSSSEELPGTSGGNDPEYVKRFSSNKFKLCDLVLNFLQQRGHTYRLIYVVDATKNQSFIQLSCNRLEIEALLAGVRNCENDLSNDTGHESDDNTGDNENGSSTLSSIINFANITTGTQVRSRRPLLVLCCVQHKSIERIPCVEIASLLDLANITDRPWHVQDVTVENLTGLESGLDWLFKQL